MGLKEAIQNIWSSDFVQKNPTKAYKVSYAAEYEKVAAYINGGPEPAWGNFSKLGKGLCEAEKERRASGQPEPGPAPGEWKVIAGEHEQFTLSQSAEVRYGADGKYNTKTLPAGSHYCDNPTFGDPAPGAIKFCETRTGVVVEPGPEPEPEPEPGPGTPIPANGRITSGGVYSGTLNNVQLVIDTEDLVTIIGSKITNTGAGDMIRGLGEGYGTHTLILDHCTITGGTGHILDTEHYDHIEVRNCTITKTAGFKLTLGNSGCTVRFLRNKVSNLQKGVSSTYGGSVVQLNHCTNPSVCEIGWNEVISIHGQHWMEDIFSIINAARVHIHDNYLDGNSRPDNTVGTNGTITLEPSSNNCLVENNQMVDVATGIYFPADCPNNTARGNRLIQDGYIGDTGIQMGSGQGGMNLHPPPNGSRMTGNTVGYVDMNGDRTDWSHMGGAPNGDAAAEIAKNTTLPDPITRQMEKDERTRWQSKLTAAGVKVGA